MICKNKKPLLLFLIFCFTIIVSRPAFSQYIYNKGNEFSAISPLMTAINSNDTHGVKFFVKAGKDAINKQNIGGASALHLAARKIDGENYINILINNGADVNLVDNSGWTPLMRSAIEGSVKNMTILLKNGANPNISNNINDTIIKHSAIANCNNCVIKSLRYVNYRILDQDLLKSQIDESIIVATKRSNLQMVEILRQYQQKVNNIIKAESLIKKRQEFLIKAEEERIKNKKIENEKASKNNLNILTSEEQDSPINLDRFIKKITNYVLVIGPPALIIENKQQKTNDIINNIDKKDKMIDIANKNMQALEEGGGKYIKNTKKDKEFFFFKKRKGSNIDLNIKKEDENSINKYKGEVENNKASKSTGRKKLEEIYVGPSAEPQKRIIYKLKYLDGKGGAQTFKYNKKTTNRTREEGIILENTTDANDGNKNSSSFIDKGKNFFKNIFSK